MNSHIVARLPRSNRRPQSKPARPRRRGSAESLAVESRWQLGTRVGTAPSTTGHATAPHSGERRNSARSHAAGSVCILRTLPATACSTSRHGIAHQSSGDSARSVGSACELTTRRAIVRGAGATCPTNSPPSGETARSPAARTGCARTMRAATAQRTSS